MCPLEGVQFEAHHLLHVSSLVGEEPLVSVYLLEAFTLAFIKLNVKAEAFSLCGKSLPNPPEGGPESDGIGDGGKWISLLPHTGDRVLFPREIGPH